jgi:hypothetical protein
MSTHAEIQEQKNHEVLTARNMLDTFLWVNSHYFEYVDRCDSVIVGLIIVTQPTLDRRASDLFMRCRQANKSALDYGYLYRNK